MNDVNFVKILASVFPIFDGLGEQDCGRNYLENRGVDAFSDSLTILVEVVCVIATELLDVFSIWGREILQNLGLGLEIYLTILLLVFGADY